jgi:hypothetical protein
MTISNLYKNKAVIFNAKDYPNEWLNQDAVKDFVAKVIKECYHFLPDDWVVLWDRCGFKEPEPKIVVGLKRYEASQNLQVTWHILPTKFVVEELYPKEEGRTREWVMFDVNIREADRFYGFQLP